MIIRNLRNVSYFCLLLASGSPVSAASFDCHRANKPFDVAVCSDPKIGLADERLAAAYHDALASTHGEWKTELVKNQRKWLASVVYEYAKNEAEAPSKERLMDWLGSELLARAEMLRQITEREKITLLEKTAEAEDVCTKTMRKSQMTWGGRDDYGLDNFTLTLPREFTRPNWKRFSTGFVTHTQLDFLNDGKVSDVYAVSVENSHYQFTWYILAHPEEKAVIERRLKDTDHFDALASDLTVEFPQGLDRGRPFSVADASTKEHAVSKLGSRLLDTSSTELYGGWYTHSNVVRYKGVTYLIAESVNNNGGPTFAVFRPQLPGKLVPQCYYRATPSIVSESRKQLDPKYRCPADLKQITTELERDRCGANFSQIDLKEWGGRRPVAQEGMMTGYALCGETTIKVGDIGRDQVETNMWPPIDDALKNGHGWLFLTQEGPYLVADQEVGQLYYRIANNTLRATCSISRRTLAPPGYHQALSAN
jgi:uncharacterized protein YecT (DUF1311 family)